MRHKIITLLLINTLAASAIAQPKQGYNNRLLVIGGGGARGAWGGGYAQRLDSMYGHYRVVYGTSTGSLLAPLIVLDSFDRLKTAYTTVSQSDIFNDNPFNSSGQPKGWNAIKQYVAGEPSLGTTHNLRNLINKFFDSTDYRKLKSSADSLRFIVTTVNMKTGEVQYKSTQDKDIPDVTAMENWMWASANEPLFMSYYMDGDAPYCDGGVLANVPLEEALQYADSNNIHYIDVVINKPVNPITDTNFINPKILSGLERLITLWETQIRNDNVEIGLFEALSTASGSESDLEKLDISEKIIVTIHYYPAYMYVGLYQSELLFDTGRMDSLWTIGRNGIEDPFITQENNQIVSSELHGHTITIHTTQVKNYLKKYKSRQAVKSQLYRKQK